MSPRPEDLPPAEAKVREAEQLYQDAAVQLNLIESVRDKRAIRDEDLQRRRLGVKAAEARVDGAKAELRGRATGSGIGLRSRRVALRAGGVQGRRPATRRWHNRQKGERKIH
jgi:hypothetical protein